MILKTSLLLLPFLGFSNGDTFTSITEMENLYDLEQGLAKALDGYLKHAKFEAEIIERHYKDLIKIESEIQDVEKYLENPINAYSVIRRMYYEWPVIFKLMSSSPFFDVEPIYPDKSVLMEGMLRIIDWQRKENLEAKELCRGWLKGIMPHANLTVSDCLEIGKIVYKTDKAGATQWLQHSLTKLEQIPRKEWPWALGSVQLLVQILEYGFLAECLSGGLEGSLFAIETLTMDGTDWYTPSLELKQDFELDQAKKCKAVAMEELRREKWIPYAVFKRYNWSTELCYNARRSTKADAGACYAVIQWDSAQFLKLEALEEGSILILHDFLPKSLILNIKLSALEEFSSLNSTGVNGPVPLLNKEITAAINKQVTFKLGILSNQLAEDLQIYLHGSGGKHATLKSYMEKVPENRAGTLYYFLNDVVRGGILAFPDKAVSIEPSRGALVLWQDSVEGLRVEECPVNVGFKWTMTQSIVS